MAERANDNGKNKPIGCLHWREAYPQLWL